MKNEDLINTSFNNNKFKEINKINNEQVNSNNNIGSFKVYIRIKPHLQNEKQKTRDSNINRINAINKTLTKDTLINETENEKIQMIKIEKNILYLEDVKNHKNNKTFLFDNIFNESTNNENIFNDAIKPMIDKILLGYNFTTLAYGVTGTGKTYTIFGDLTSNFGENGIIFKACDYLFEKIELNKKEENKSNIINYFIKISYFEIYNEIVRDLINENSSPLMLVEDPQKGVMCSNAKEVIINDSVELKKIINKSNKKRTMASTNLNQFSSRSHALLQMTLEKKVQRVDSEDNYDIYNSKFLVVDLAGSERGAEKGKRREEGVNINKSLFTLSNCLNILSEKSNTGKFVPYRDSKLTRLLKDSLGGNILTVMIACISSLSINYDETLSSLNYAFKAKKITKKVMKNIKEINLNNMQYKEMIDSLKKEIFQLKNIIKNQEIRLKEKVSPNKEIIMNNNDTINIHEQFEIKEEKQIEENKGIMGVTSDKKNLENEKEICAESSNIINNIEKEINVEIYNNYIEELTYGNMDMNRLKTEIESLKKDKNLLENYLLKDNEKDDNINNKYNSIKIIYNKFIEVINERLMDNIEQNMIYNFNVKEITELNKANYDKIIELEKAAKEGKMIEEINYTKKNIEENNIQKNQIIESIKKNDEQKEELKKLLLNLLSNKGDSMNQYIHILKEKDKLIKITKQYEKQIENYVKIQKQKDEDLNKINRKIEILRAKLKEKDKKINELEKKGGKQKLEIKNTKFINNFNNTNLNKNKLIENNKTETDKNKSIKMSYKTYINSIKRNDSNKNKKLLSPINKGQRKTINQKKLSHSYINREKYINNMSNQSFNATKRLSTITNKEKILKNYKKINNINFKYKTEENDENINNCNLNDIFELKKYKELTIPKTTITLEDLDNFKKINKPIYIKMEKSNNKNRIKKSTNNKINNNKINKKKYSSIIRNNSKNISSNNSEIMIKYKSNLIKSITVDLKRNKYSPESNLNKVKSNKDKKSDNSKNSQHSDNNILIIQPFKPEKLCIDLNKIQNLKDSVKNDLNEKIKSIRLSKVKKDKHQKIINRNEKLINSSKSNPKLLIEKKSNKNYIKKLSLQEARFENKLKYEKIPKKKYDLNIAESFINEYKKLKHGESEKNQSNNKVNRSTTTLITKNKKIEENDTKSCMTDYQVIKNDKKHTIIDDFKSEGKYKELYKN